MTGAFVFAIGAASLVAARFLPTTPVKDGGRTPEAFAATMLGVAWIAVALLRKSLGARAATLLGLLLAGSGAALLVTQPHWLQWIRIRPYELKSWTTALGWAILAFQAAFLTRTSKDAAAIMVKFVRESKAAMVGVGLVFLASAAHLTRLYPQRADPRAVLLFAAEISATGAVVVIALWNLLAFTRAVPEAALAKFERATELAVTHERRVVLGAAFLAFGLSAFTAIRTFGGVSHIPDGVAYEFQAQMLAEGRVSVPAPPEADAFKLYLLDVVDGRWFATTHPGWPALLAIGRRVGFPWLVNPILAACSVLLIHGAAKRVTTRGTALGAALLTATSPWFLFLAASDMTHTASLFLMLVTWRALAAAHDRETGGVAVVLRFVAGFAAGYLCLVRPLDGALVGLLSGLAALVAKPKAWWRLIAFALGAIAGAALFLPFNAALTGHATHFPLNDYLDRLWYPGANRLGFGADVGNPPGTWGLLDPIRGHGPMDVLLNTNQNLYNLNFETFGWTIGALLLPAWHVMKGKWSAIDRAILFFLAVLVAAYNLYWFSGGPDFGARYWFLIYPAVLWLTLRGAETLARGANGGRRSRIAIALVAASLAGIIVFLPWRAATKYVDYRGFHADYRTMAERGDFGDALVFVHTRSESDWGSAFLLNAVEPSRTKGPVFVRAREAADDQRVIAAFPNRKVMHVFGKDITGDQVRIGVPR